MEYKLDNFRKAIESFTYLVSVDIEELSLTWDTRLIDGLLNGMIQKFEYTTELCWKTIKKFLETEGIETKTPKEALKMFFNSDFIDEETYFTLISAIEDRNTLSHVYDENEFKNIIADLNRYAKTYSIVFETIRKKVGK